MDDELWYTQDVPSKAAGEAVFGILCRGEEMESSNICRVWAEGDNEPWMKISRSAIHFWHRK